MSLRTNINFPPNLTQWIMRQMLLPKQDVLTLPEHQMSLSVFMRVLYRPSLGLNVSCMFPACACIQLFLFVLPPFHHFASVHICNDWIHFMIQQLTDIEHECSVVKDETN